ISVDHEDLSVIGCACLVTTPIPEVLTYFRSPRRSQPVWELQLAPPPAGRLTPPDQDRLLDRADRAGLVEQRADRGAHPVGAVAGLGTDPDPLAVRNPVHMHHQIGVEEGPVADVD